MRMTHPLVLKMWSLTLNQGGAAMSLLHNTEAELDTVICEELDFAPACQSAFHPLGEAGHVPSESATFSATCPACGQVFLICAGRALKFWEASTITLVQCTEGCNEATPAREWSVFRIPGL